jgi:hypothetical protein
MTKHWRPLLTDRPDADVERDVAMDGIVKMEDKRGEEGVVAVEAVKQPSYKHLVFCEYAVGLWWRKACLGIVQSY